MVGYSSSWPATSQPGLTDGELLACRIRKTRPRSEGSVTARATSGTCAREKGGTGRGNQIRERADGVNRWEHALHTLGADGSGGCPERAERRSWSFSHLEQMDAGVEDVLARPHAQSAALKPGRQEGLAEVDQQQLQGQRKGEGEAVGERSRASALWVWLARVPAVGPGGNMG